MTQARGMTWCACVLVVVHLLACGDDDGAAASGAGDGGQGGVGAIGGDSGAGGDAGSGGVGGDAGSGGNAGSSGTGANGGSGGSGGVGGSGGDAGSSGTGANGGSGGDAGSGGVGGNEPLTTSCAESPWNESDFAQVIDVGPGRDVATPSDVAWESIDAGTLVRIHARAEPYRDKWVLNVAGTEDDPVVVRGVPDDQGNLPVISGENATTRTQINFWGEERSVIKIGGSNTPDNAEPSHIFVECLDIQRAHADYTFTNDGGTEQSYAENAAAITIESGDHITLRNNVFHECGNGLFAASASSDVKVIGNHIFDNGNVGSIYEHNSYTESLGILFEANWYGPLCDGCPGNNLKDRSAGTVVRYNLIEAGNRQLDLVDSGHAELTEHASYRSTFVYGNVLVEPDGAGNSQVVHYGGDSANTDNFRKGTLYFFHNTVVSTRNGNTTLVRLSTADETIDARNNILYATAGGQSLAITDGNGDAYLRTNWISEGFRPSHSTLNGRVDAMSNVTGDDPGLVDIDNRDFMLDDDSACRGVGGPLAEATSAHVPAYQISAATVLVPRPAHALIDVGAIEHAP